MRRCIAAALCLLPAVAMADTDSTYTKLDFKDTKACTDLTPPPVEGEPNDGVAYECKGLGDQVVSFSEGDLRSSVSFGTLSGDHCAARQSFSGFMMKLFTSPIRTA